MTIKDASAYFDSLKTMTDNKSEIKIFNNFIDIFSDLEDRELSVKQLKLIEKELDVFELTADIKNRRRYFSKKLESFKKFLKDKLSLISEGYYTAIGISLGIALGAAFGVVWDESVGITYGLSLGLIIGLLIGKVLDTRTVKQNRVIRVKKK